MVSIPQLKPGRADVTSHSEAEAGMGLRRAESCVEQCFRNKIAFIPPNMCSVRLRHNLTMFNKSPFVAFRLRQEKWNMPARL